jgi:hypothetical protein
MGDTQLGGFSKVLDTALSLSTTSNTAALPELLANLSLFFSIMLSLLSSPIGDEDTSPPSVLCVP